MRFGSTLRRQTCVPPAAVTAQVIGPARAVEHRQRPQVAAVVVELEGQRVGERAEIGAAMAVDRALGIAGGAGRVEQADAVPLVLAARDRRTPDRPTAMKPSYSTPPKLGAPAVSASAMSTTIGALGAELLQRRRDGGVKLAVGEQQLGLAVLQAEGDQRRIEADVDRVQHGADHRRRVVRLQHRRHVGARIATVSPRLMPALVSACASRRARA